MAVYGSLARRTAEVENPPDSAPLGTLIPLLVVFWLNLALASPYRSMDYFQLGAGVGKRSGIPRLVDFSGLVKRAAQTLALELSPDIVCTLPH